MDLEGHRRMFGGLPAMAVASIGADGAPHVVPLWFVWDADAIWCSVRIGSRTWDNVARDPRVAMTIDVGRAWTELTGVSLHGRATLLPIEDPSMRGVASRWHEKYRGLFQGEGFERFAAEVDRLGFLRVVPDDAVAWDHAQG